MPTLNIHVLMYNVSKCQIWKQVTVYRVTNNFFFIKFWINLIQKYTQTRIPIVEMVDELLDNDGWWTGLASKLLCQNAP